MIAPVDPLNDKAGGRLGMTWKVGVPLKLAVVNATGAIALPKNCLSVIEAGEMDAHGSVENVVYPGPANLAVLPSWYAPVT